MLKKYNIFCFSRFQTFNEQSFGKFWAKLDEILMSEEFEAQSLRSKNVGDEAMKTTKLLQKTGL